MITRPSPGFDCFSTREINDRMFASISNWQPWTLPCSPPCSLAQPPVEKPRQSFTSTDTSRIDFVLPASTTDYLSILRENRLDAKVRYQRALRKSKEERVEKPKLFDFSSASNPSESLESFSARIISSHSDHHDVSPPPFNMDLFLERGERESARRGQERQEERMREWKLKEIRGELTPISRSAPEPFLFELPRQTRQTETPRKPSIGSVLVALLMLPFDMISFDK